MAFFHGMATITALVTGPFEENCYIIRQDPDIVVIDPGASARRIRATIEGMIPSHLAAIMLTHGHFDHIGAVDQLYGHYHCPIYACADDADILADAEKNKYYEQTATVNSPIRWLQGDSLDIGGMKFKVFYTPGHTPGSVMYQLDGMLFTGDTLFKDSVGRTDLYGGSDTHLKQSLAMISRMDPGLTVYPGHGPYTSIWQELKNNVYLH